MLPLLLHSVGDGDMGGCIASKLWVDCLVVQVLLIVAVNHRTQGMRFMLLEFNLRRRRASRRVVRVVVLQQMLVLLVCVVVKRMLCVCHML